MSNSLEIRGAGWLVVPDDVTPLEAARLAEFLAKVWTLKKWDEPDLAEEVKAHGLERLFHEWPGGPT